MSLYYLASGEYIVTSEEPTIEKFGMMDYISQLFGFDDTKNQSNQSVKVTQQVTEQPVQQAIQQATSSKQAASSLK